MPTPTVTAPGVLDVLPELGSWRASEASERRLYSGEGTSLSARLRRAREKVNPTYDRDLLEAAQLYERVVAGDKWAALTFNEAMTTSDFPNLFGDILDRQILAAYVQQPVLWDQLARRGRVRDFRTVNRFTLDGGQAILDEVKEQTEYPAASLIDGKYAYRVKKYGRRIPISWETLVNDDLDAFSDIPTRLGNAARRSEERFATDLYAGTAGPDATFFAAGNANVVTGNPVLSIAALQTAFTVLSAMVDTDGAPIYVEAAVLVVPPALEVTANNIINATEIVAAGGGGDGTGNDQLRVTNWMRNKVRVLVNPWLPLISATNGNTSWYLFANPGAGRPAMEIGFLIGHEQPELFQKHPNASRVGGAAVDPTDGDFDSDSVTWKLRHTFGGTLMDPKSGVASNGTGV